VLGVVVSRRLSARVLGAAIGLCLSHGCSDADRSASEVSQSASAVLAERTVDATGDTYLKSGSPNQNQGSAPTLRLQASGKNRALVFFDPASIRNSVGG